MRPKTKKKETQGARQKNRKMRRETKKMGRQDAKQKKWGDKTGDKKKWGDEMRDWGVSLRLKVGFWSWPEFFGCGMGQTKGQDFRNTSI